MPAKIKALGVTATINAKCEWKTKDVAMKTLLDIHTKNHLAELPPMATPEIEVAERIAAELGGKVLWRKPARVKRTLFLGAK